MFLYFAKLFNKSLAPSKPPKGQSQKMKLKIAENKCKYRE